LDAPVLAIDRLRARRHLHQAVAAAAHRLRNAKKVVGREVEQSNEERVLGAEEAGARDEPRAEGGAGDAAAALPQPPRQLAHQQHVAELAVFVCLVGIKGCAIYHARAAGGQAGQVAERGAAADGAALGGRVMHLAGGDYDTTVRVHLGQQQVGKGKMAQVVRSDRELEAVGGEPRRRLAAVLHAAVEQQPVHGLVGGGGEGAHGGQAGQVAGGGQKGVAGQRVSGTRSLLAHFIGGGRSLLVRAAGERHPPAAHCQLQRRVATYAAVCAWRGGQTQRSVSGDGGEIFERCESRRTHP